jgi:uncharacterized protein
MNLNKALIGEIKKLCESSKVKSLSAFGSVTREDFDEQSDIDLVVDFEEKDPHNYTDLYFQFKTNLEALLKRQVDLVEERGIKNRFFRQELEKTKFPIYGH